MARFPVVLMSPVVLIVLVLAVFVSGGSAHHDLSIGGHDATTGHAAATAIDASSGAGHAPFCHQSGAHDVPDSPQRVERLTALSPIVIGVVPSRASAAPAAARWAVRGDVARPAGRDHLVLAQIARI